MLKTFGNNSTSRKRQAVVVNVDHCLFLGRRHHAPFISYVLLATPAKSGCSICISLSWKKFFLYLSIFWSSLLLFIYLVPTWFFALSSCINLGQCACPNRINTFNLKILNEIENKHISNFLLKLNFSNSITAYFDFELCELI